MVKFHGIFPILLCLCWFHCNPTEKRIAFNPFQTALGELVEVKWVTEIQINDQIIVSQPGQRLLVLIFAGQTKIPYQSAGGREDYYVILDSTNPSATQYPPVFVGAHDSTGKLSDQLDWKMNGTMSVRNGQMVFSGMIELTRPEVVLLYRLPEQNQPLYLKEDGQFYLLLNE